MTNQPSRLRYILPAIIVLAVGLVGCSKEDAGTAQPQKQPAADVAAGKMVAEQRCGTCHGIDGRGKGPAIPTLAGQPEAYLLAAMAEYKDGRRHHAALRAIPLLSSRPGAHGFWETTGFDGSTNDRK